MSTDLVQHAFHGQEAWRPIPGWEGLYEVSDAGRVRSLPRADSRGRTVHGRILACPVKASGHLHTFLARDGGSWTVLVHRIVLEAFVGPCPVGMEGCHNNGEPSDNRLANLRWDTRSANRHDAVRHGVDPNASRSHCKRGHVFDESNTYLRDGRRHCRRCGALRMQMWRLTSRGVEPVATERHLEAV